MLNRDFKEFAGLLNAEGVEYLVVGQLPRRIDLLTNRPSATTRLENRPTAGAAVAHITR
jgi:hypothetical protein